MPKVHKYHELVSRLKRYDSRFIIYLEKGKGSHRMKFPIRSGAGARALSMTKRPSAASSTVSSYPRECSEPFF
jgi:hypothetical protein